MKHVLVLLLCAASVFTLLVASDAQQDRQKQQYVLDRQLIDAIKNNDAEQAIALVKAGANPNTRYDPDPMPISPLPSGQPPHTRPPVNHSPTALMLACGRNSDYIVGDIRQFPDLPENIDLIQVMLKHGANVNTRDSRENTALLLATNNEDRFRTVELLLLHGANVNAQDSTGFTPMMNALVPMSIYISAKDLAGFKPPMYAQNYNPTNTVRLLLKHGANPNLYDDNGDTALHHIIFDAYSDFNEDNKREVGYLRLILTREASLIHLLLAHGADPKKKDRAGVTPIQAAQQQKRPDLDRLLKGGVKRVK